MDRFLSPWYWNWWNYLQRRMKKIISIMALALLQISCFAVHRRDGSFCVLFVYFLKMYTIWLCCSCCSVAVLLLVFRLTSRNIEPAWEKVQGLKFELLPKTTNYRIDHRGLFDHNHWAPWFMNRGHLVMVIWSKSKTDSTFPHLLNSKSERTNRSVRPE